MPPRSARATPLGSIHAVLVVGSIALLLFVLGGVAWLSYDASELEAEELFDARLATSARVLEALVARQVETATINAPIVVTLPKPLEMAAEELEATPLGHPYETKIAFQVWRADGTLLVRSASAPAEAFAPMAAGFTTRRIGQHAWRVFVLPSSGVAIQVAERYDARNELATKLALVAVAPLAVGGPVLIVLLSLLIRYGLSPLAQLARRIELRRPGSLEPVRLSRESAEIAPVTRALNGLLSRMQEAFARERRFTAAAAHELRTPLAALQIHAQNAARASSEIERRDSLDRMLAALGRIVHLSEQMLAYSRAAIPPESRPLEPIVLEHVVADALADIEPRFHARDMQLALVVADDAGRTRIRGDRDKIASVVGNLLENALNYSPAGSAVAVELARGESTITLAVVDAGAGIAPELRERVFESYFRIPGSAGSGSGLGLAIVKEIALQHGATIEVGDGPEGRGTRVSVTFPALADDASHAGQVARASGPV
jgi:two-component system sensor histidine kinase QseC